MPPTQPAQRGLCQSQQSSWMFFTDLGLTTLKLYPFTFLLESGNPQTADCTASSKHYLPSGYAGRKAKFYTFQAGPNLKATYLPLWSHPSHPLLLPRVKPSCMLCSTLGPVWLSDTLSTAQPSTLSPSHSLPWQPLSLGCPPLFKCEQTHHPTPVGRLFTNSFFALVETRSFQGH